ncbi:MAG: hypothetical protein IKZ91_03305 [Bacteroidales bacterium]|nr:hypothetical protein [Bacteroidales bacterium]
MDKNSKTKLDWRQFFISVLGTAIGVALTFIISGKVERRNQEQAQRLTAIMVIHDIDNTIDILKSWKEQEEEGRKLLAYLQDHKDQKDPIPSDTLSEVFDLLVRSNAEVYHFDTSKEKIFNSDVDIWQNLGNMKFIDNVQDIFNQRQQLLDLTNTTEWFSKPIPQDEYMQIIMGGWATEQLFNEQRWSFLKKKLQENRVSYYISLANYRVSSLSEYIDRFSLLNDENKFIMGITDREMDNYVNSISNKGIALTRSALLGHWLFSKKEQRLEYDFRSDNTFTITNNLVSEFTRTRYWSGIIKAKLIYDGAWSLQRDSLIMTIDVNKLDVQMDPSGIEVKENMQDSLSSWIQRYRDYLHGRFRDDLSKKTDNIVYQVRLDSSKDKMEWTGANGEVRYIKRMDE